MRAMTCGLMFVALGVLVAVGPGCVTGGGGGGGVPGPAGDFEAGQATYQGNCTECHGTPGEADGTAPDLEGQAAGELEAGLAAVEDHRPVDLTTDDYANLEAFLEVEEPTPPPNENGEEPGPGPGEDNENAVGPGPGPGEDNENAVGPGPGEDEDALVKTRIVLEDYATLRQIEAGDDLVVYTIGVNETQSFAYFVPSTYDDMITEGKEITNGRLYGRQQFVVAGKKVVMSDESGQVWIYDTATETMVDIDRSLVSLESDYMVGDGEFVAVFTDDEGNKLKVIDTSANEPVVTSFPDAFEIFVGGADYEMIAVDAANRRVAVAGAGAFYVWDIDTPGEPLSEFDLSYAEGGEGIDGDMFQLEDDWILYRQGNEWATALLNVTDGSITVFADSVGTYSPHSEIELNGGSFGFFYNVVSTDFHEFGSLVRSAIGSVATAPDMTAAPPFEYYPPPEVDSPQPEDWGQVGYGRTMCITPDGGRWFIAGTLYPSHMADPLQMSTGGTFESFADDESLSGRVQASDPSSSENVVAFWVLRQFNCENNLCDDEIVIGFIMLDRL